MKIIKLFFIAVLPALLLLTGCALEEPNTKITKTDLNSQDFSKYVSIGNSLTAGYQSGSLVANHQVYSYPNLIAGQLGIEGFEQPTVSFPGIPNIMQLTSLDGGLGYASGTGLPTNSTLTRPYDNLGIPGIVLADVAMDVTSTATSLSGSQLIDLVLRLQDTNILEQAGALNPTFVTCWIGNNDVLGFATSGGVSPSAPTPGASFQALYTGLAAALAGMADKVAVANIPDVTAIAFFTTVGPKIAESLTAAGAPGMYYQTHGNTGAAALTDVALTANLADKDLLVTLVGGTYAALIGQATDQWYQDLAASMGISVTALLATMPTIDTTQPFGVHPQNPWPDALILDAAEIVTAQAAVTEFNGYIEAAATANNFAFFDANALFDDIAANGYHEYGVHLTTDFILGGLFSLDGVHPSNLGYGVVANEFIEVMNAEFDVNIAPVNLLSVAGNPPVAKARAAEVKHNIFTLGPVVEMLGGKLK